MARIKRRQRVRCKLPCEIMVSSAKVKRYQGRVITLSEGGLAVVTGIHFEQGDSIRIVIDPKGARPIKVSAIVWNDTTARSAGGESRLHRIGCVISQRSESYAALLRRLMPTETETSGLSLGDMACSIPIALPKRQDPEKSWAEPDLPRSRDLQPPTKLVPEEMLPYFQIRLKQIGGPRTRIMTIQARSATQAELRALEELASITGASAGWGVLHVNKLKGGPR